MAEELSAAGVVAEPKGLSLSLDQLIREKQDHNPGDGRAAPRQQEYEQRRGGHQGRGRGGRGGRGIDRGHFNSGYGPQQGWQAPGPFPGPQRLVRVDTGAEMGHPGAGPVLFLPPEFLAQQAQQGPGFGWPMPFIAGPGGPPGMSGMPGAFIGRNGGGGGAARPLPPSRERCSVDEETGEVVVRLGRTDIVRVSPMGEVTLNSGGSSGGEVFAALNSALAPLGIRITSAGPQQWSVSDGKSLTRFQDGLVLPSKGAASASRGRVLLAHYKTPGASSAAAAATAASNAAAARAGLLPAADMAGPIVVGPFNGAGFNGAMNGYGFGGQQQFFQGAGKGEAMNGGGPERTQRYVSGGPQQARRLKAQGRYAPY